MIRFVYNLCKIDGDAKEIKRLEKLVLQKKKRRKRVFSCQAVIPMPDYVIESEKNPLGFAVLSHEVPGLVGDGPAECLDLYLLYKWVKSEGITTRDQLVAWVKKNNPDIIEGAKRTIDFFKQNGCEKWNEWRATNWGSPNECWDYRELSYTPNRWTFTFITFQAPAGPVFDKLFRELFPTLKADIAFADEWREFAGTGLYQNGVGGLSYAKVADEVRRLYASCFAWHLY
jgi:hypothetical protein